MLGTSIVIRIPSFFEPHWYGDEGIFAAVAQQLLNGRILYEGTWDHKPPLIYFLYSATFALFGYSMPALRAVTTIAVVLTQVFIYRTALPPFGTRRAAIAAFLYGVLVTLPILEGQVALTEVFMVVMTAGAIMLYVRSRVRVPWQAPLKWSAWIAIGTLFGLASLFKPVALLDLAAMLSFIALFERERLRSGGLVVLGFASPWLLTILLFTLVGAFSAFFNANVTYQLSYVQSSPDTDLRLIATLAPPLLGIAFAALERERPFRSLIVLWLGFAITGAVLGGFPYAHYLIQVYAPAALAAGAFLARPHLSKSLVPAAAITAILWLTVIFYFNLGSFDDMNSYYRGFASAIWSGDRGKFDDVFGDGWSGTRDEIAQLEDAGVRGHSLLLWGERAWTYPLLDARPVSKFVVWYHVLGDPDREREVVTQARSVPAQFIVLEDEVEVFPDLEQLIKQRYACDPGDRITICRLVDAPVGR